MRQATGKPYESFRVHLGRTHTPEGLTVMGEDFVLIQRKEGDWRSVLLLATDLNQHCHENL